MMRCRLAVPLFFIAAATLTAQAPICTVSYTDNVVIEPDQNTFSSGGASALVNEASDVNCGSWTVTSDQTWLHFTGATNGPAGTPTPIPYTADPNTGGPRQATITVNWAGVIDVSSRSSATYTVFQTGIVPLTGSPFAVQYRIDLAYNSAGCGFSAQQPFNCLSTNGPGPYIILNLPPGVYIIQTVNFHVPNSTAFLTPLVFAGTSGGTQSVQEIPTVGSTAEVEVTAGLPLYLYALNTNSVTDTSTLDPNNFVDVTIANLSCTNSSGPTQVGVAYSTSCSGNGGTPPWTVTQSAGTSIAGLTGVDNSDGTATVSGTPTNAAVGNYFFSMTGQDSAASPIAPAAFTVPFSGTLPPPSGPLEIGCSPSYGPSDTFYPYSAVCTASGGTPPYTWNTGTTTLPDGLTLTPNGATATIAGTLTTAQNYTYTLQVSDSTSATAQYNFKAIISPGGEGSPLEGCSPASADGNDLLQLEVGVEFTAICSGNFASTWFLNNSTSLPDGLTLTAGGDGSFATITGVPTANALGAFNFTIGTTFDDTGTNDISFFGTINAQVTITCANAGGNLILGAPYSNTCTGAGGVPVAGTVPLYAYWISAGALPAGLALSSTTGAISGAPTATGAYSFTVQVYDSAHGVAATGFTVSGNIAAPLAITCASGNGPLEVGIAYTNTCNVTGGFPPYDIFLGQSLSPPPGITFTSAPTSATIAGTPTAAEAYRYIVQVFDSSDASVSQTFSGSIAAALGVSCTNTAAPTQVGVPYTTICTAAPGVSPFTWTTANLPAGLTTTALTASPLTISGSPTQAGAVNYSVSVRDAATASVQQSWQGNILPPVPVLTSSNPASGVATIAATLTLTGSGFVAGTVVTFNGSPLTPANITATTLTVAVPGNLISLAGVYPISVTTAGGTSGAVNFPVAPLLSVVSPNTAVAGSPALSVTVTGAGFVSESVNAVNWNGTPLTTVFVSPTQLTATVPATDLATATTANITVLSAGQRSNALPFTVNAAPVITSLSPSSAATGSAALVLTINGTGLAGATAQFGQTALSLNLVSATQISAVVPATLLATSGVYPVTASVGGVTSNSLPFTVSSAPVITSLSPASVANGSPAFTLTVNGTGYASSAVVQWNGAPLTTTFVTAGQLTAAVPATLLTAPDVATVTVLSGGVTSAPTSFSITATAAIVGLATTITPDQPSTVGVSVANPASVDLNGSLQLSFTPGVGGLPPDYVNQDLQFSCTGGTCSDGKSVLHFTIPAGQTSVSPVPGGTITPGTVAGTITVTLATLTRVDTQANVAPATPVTATVQVPKMMPVTMAGSVQITGLTASGFNVELNGFSNTRELSSITVTFMPAPGTRLNGTTSFTIPVSSAFAGWFNSAGGQTNGGSFGLTIPFTLSGDTKVINSVTVTLTNSIGTSTPETGTVAQ